MTRAYGDAVRAAVDVGVPEAGREEAQNRYWRSLVAKALLTARGALSGDPGPVHLNLPFREPLLPKDADVRTAGPWSGRPDGVPWTDGSVPADLAGASPAFTPSDGAPPTDVRTFAAGTSQDPAAGPLPGQLVREPALLAEDRHQGGQVGVGP